MAFSICGLTLMRARRIGSRSSICSPKNRTAEYRLLNMCIESL